jgi:hypothetical protein
VITIDNVGKSPTPIVIYNVEGGLDSPTTKNNNRQNFDYTQKLDNNMMPIEGGDGE